MQLNLYAIISPPGEKCGVNPLRAPWRYITATVLALLPLYVTAGEAATSAPLPAIAIIIDDLGDRLHDGLRATALPGKVTCAVLPQTTYSHRLAEAAYASGKEVMLHQPMQSTGNRAMGPGGIDLSMNRAQMWQTLQANLESVPHARGINNHMGSLLTRFPGQMGWIMEALQQRGGLYFVDSATTALTIARKVALEHNIPSVRRNIFLDNKRNEADILHQFARLVERARYRGVAIGISHPYPESLAVLEKVLPHIEEFGVRLLPVSELIQQNSRQEERLWQASLSPSQPAAKSSKQ